jgi:hypothetical protein
MANVPLQQPGEKGCAQMAVPYLLFVAWAAICVWPSATHMCVLQVPQDGCVVKR